MDYKMQELLVILTWCLLVIASAEQQNETGEGFIYSSSSFLGAEEFNHFTAVTSPVSEIGNDTAKWIGIKLKDPESIPLSCDTDFERQELYYYDYNSRQIGLIENFDLINYFNLTISVFQAAVGEDWVFVAVDWLSHNVYWTDGMLGQIFIKKGGRTNDNTAYTTVIRRTGRPRGLAVDPLAGYIFWTDTKHDTIMSASLVGKNVRTIVYPGQSRTPSSIALDMTSRTLYWTDRENINSISYDGQDRRGLFRYSYANFYDIILFQNVLIATDIENWYTHFIDPITGEEVINKDGSTKEAHYGLCTYENMSRPAYVPQDMCENYGCEHICVIEPNEVEPTCVCHDGYTLKDKKMCEATTYPYHRGIVLNTGSRLCIVNIAILSDHQDETPTCFYTAPTNKTISYMDLDMKDRLVFFSIENIIYSVKIDQVNQTADKILEQNQDILGLSYDWTDELLYYALDTIPEFSSIWRTDPFTGNTVLSEMEMVESPRALAVSPHDRKVFWVAGRDEDSDQIMYTDLSMESGNVTIIETQYSLEHVTHIYHHVDSETLYMLDDTRYGKELVQMEYDGNYADYPLNLDNDILDFVAYESYILMAIHNGDDPDTTLKSADLRYSPLVTIATGKILGLGKVVGIKILDLDLLQPEYPNPCGKSVHVDNGGCDQICLPDATQEMAECHCTLGFDLINNTKCMSEPVTDNFILISDVSYDSIFQIPIADGQDSTNIFGIRTPKLGSPTGIVYDYSKGTIITTNNDFGDVMSVYLNGSIDFRIPELQYAYPDRFAFDPHSELIFYSAISWLSDYYYDSYIGVINKMGEDNKIYEGAHYPRAIVIHPRKGWLFFTDHGNFPGIFRIDMDGGNYQEIVTDDTTDIRWPNGLAIDYNGNRLFWADGHYDFIKSVDLDTLAVQEILLDKGAHPMGLKYVNGFMYYSAWNNIQIKRFPVTEPTNVTNFGPKHSLGGITDIDVYMSAFTNAENMPENLGCSVNNGGCSDFCLPNSTGHSCGCAYYSDLLLDGRTCDNVPRCPPILLSAEVEESETCLRIEADICPFTCKTNYKPKYGVTTVTCTSESDIEFENVLQWDNNDPCEEILCPLEIANVELNMTSCDRRVDSDCMDYVCVTGYERNPAITSLVCQLTGQWEMTGPLCIPKCPVLTSTNDNAVLHPSCNRDVNEDCRLICDEGYTSSVSRVTCLPESQWNLTPDTECKEILCKDYFDGGFIEPACNRNLQMSCGYSCDTGLQPNPSVPAYNLTCMDDGVWSHKGPDGAPLCIVPAVTAASKTNKVAVGVGIGGCLLILLILLLVFFLYRSGRLLGSKSHPPVSITSLENPRYTASGTPIEGSQMDSSLSYAKLDEDAVQTSRSENVYDDIPSKHR